jgi:hypothetical protein
MTKITRKIARIGARERVALARALMMMVKGDKDDSKVSVALARATVMTRTREVIMGSVAMMTAMERGLRIGDNEDEKDSLTPILSLALKVHSIVLWW